MNTVPTREELKALTDHSANPCITLYMPTVRGGPETRQNPIRFKNLYNQVQEKLAAEAEHDRKLSKMLRSGWKLHDDYQFWQHQSDGLAFFQSPEVLRTYRLPIAFKELVVANNRFHIKPLLPVISSDTMFYILAVSKKGGRLYRADRFSIHEVTVPGMPPPLTEALGEDEPPEYRAHRTAERVAPNMAPSGAKFHGHGFDGEHSKDKVLRYFRKVDDALWTLLHESHHPMVLAAVEFEHSIYHEVNRYPHLLKEGIVGSPDHMKPAELLQKAWPIVDRLFAQSRREAEESYQSLSGSPRAASELDKVLPAAYGGRVEALFVAVGRQQWGHYNPQTQEIVLREHMEDNAQDLLDYAAIQTFLNGGKVFAVHPDQVPGARNLAAVFRY